MSEQLADDDLDGELEKRIAERVASHSAGHHPRGAQRAAEHEADEGAGDPEASSAAPPLGGQGTTGQAGPTPRPSSASTGAGSSTGATSPSAAPLSLGSEVEVGRRILARLRGSSNRALVFTRGEFHAYDHGRGVFEVVVNGKMKKLAQTFDGALIVNKGVSTLKISKRFRDGALACASAEVEDVEFFLAATPGFAFTNGFVTVSANGISIVPHSPAHRAADSVPYAYNARAVRRKWLKFLDEIFLGDPDKAEKIALLQEFIGACLVGIITRFEMVLVLLGRGSNGKSVFIDVVRALLPKHAVVAVPPQAWGHEYKVAALARARLNAVGEIPERAIIESDAFKAIVSGDLVSGRHPHREVMSFAPTAGHLFAANRLPATGDQSDGFWRRFMIVGFNRAFAPPGAKLKQTTTKSRERSSLIEDLKSELPGIMAWALDGAVAVMNRGHFVPPKSHTEILAKWRESVDQVAEFIISCCDPCNPNNTSDWSSGSDLYRAYARWAPGAGHKNVLGTRKFGERLKDLVTRQKTTSANRYAVKLRPERTWGDPDL